jgi:biopolymer transport protein ExbD
MTFQSFESTHEPLSEINVTPLVDVMLVLLVIFIITAPLFTQVLPLELPRVKAQAATDPPETIELALTGASQLQLAGRSLAPEALEAALRAEIARRPEATLKLSADRSVPYERVAQALALAQAAGISRIGLVTQTGETHATRP